MTKANPLQQLRQGEDSRNQFKRNITNADSLAAELAAFANSGGGTLFMGVNDDGSIAGLSAADVRLGKTNRRNPTLTEHAFKLLPYRGLGSGIPRALGEWPRIELIDDVRGNQFSAVIARPEPEWGSGAEPVTVGALHATPPPGEANPPVTDQVTPEVERLLLVLDGEMGRTELMGVLGLKDEKHFRESYQQAAIQQGLIEMTIPDKPRSRLQKYRLTAAGRALLQAAQKGAAKP